MAKLIGHYYNTKSGSLEVFEVDKLKETEKQFKKTSETIGDSPGGSFDYWTVIPKSDLGQLRRPSAESFIMFALKKDVPGFMVLVTDWLEQAAEKKKESYDSALKLLNAARDIGQLQMSKEVQAVDSMISNADDTILDRISGGSQPLVTVTFSEHEKLRGITKMPLYLADEMFANLDAMPREQRSPDGAPYHKTDFTIEFVWYGETKRYKGQYNVGEGGGSLIGHIHDCADYYLADPGYQQYLAGKGTGEQEVTNARNQFISARIVPYFKQHCELSRMEADALSDITEIQADGQPSGGGTARIAYLESLMDYAKQARVVLNEKGLEKLRDVPAPLASAAEAVPTSGEKPSVLEQIRAARQAPREPSTPEAKKLKKDGPEL
jgi:hypothetical protein